MPRFLLFLIVVLIIGSGGLYVGARYLEHKREAYNSEIAGQKKQDYSITIIEGKRREEIAQELAAAGICSYSDFLAASTADEGHLFPDTYRFYKDTPASQVVTTFTRNFALRMTTNQISPTQDQLILASIVEREARDDSERAAIAGVYTNRLALGMNLEADPTVQYARDNRDNHSDLPNPISTPTTLNYHYWGSITQDDYHSVISPYNTYLNPGLPPAPIANPGLASIKAAISPQANSYLYFFHANNQTYFSKTLQEHLQKLQRYQN